LGLALSPPLWPHAGHDHGAGPEDIAVPLDPRAEAHSEGIEMVLVLEGSELLIYLDDFGTNEPIGDAEVLVETMTETGPREDPAEADSDGVYRLETPWLAKPGSHDLMVSVQDPRRFDLLTARLEVPTPDQSPEAHPILERPKVWQVAGAFGGIFLIGLVAGGLLGGARRSRQSNRDDTVDVDRTEMGHGH
jgi:hypothetical protein